MTDGYAYIEPTGSGQICFNHVITVIRLMSLLLYDAYVADYYMKCLLSDWQGAKICLISDCAGSRIFVLIFKVHMLTVYIFVTGIPL